MCVTRTALSVRDGTHEVMMTYLVGDLIRFTVRRLCFAQGTREAQHRRLQAFILEHVKLQNVDAVVHLRRARERVVTVDGGV